jgi:hypothetical protein
MGVSKTSIRITTPVPLSLGQNLTREGLFNKFLGFRFVLFFDVLEAEEGFLLFANTARVRVSDKAVVGGFLALGPLVNLVCFLIQAGRIKSLIRVECRSVGVFANSWDFILCCVLAFHGAGNGIKNILLATGAQQDPSAIWEHLLFI